MYCIICLVWNSVLVRLEHYLWMDMRALYRICMLLLSLYGALFTFVFIFFSLHWKLNIRYTVHFMFFYAHSKEISQLSELCANFCAIVTLDWNVYVCFPRFNVTSNHRWGIHCNPHAEYHLLSVVSELNVYKVWHCFCFPKIFYLFFIIQTMAAVVTDLQKSAARITVQHKSNF